MVKILRYFISLIALSLLSACSSEHAITPVPDVQLKWKLVENGFEGRFSSHAQLTIINKGTAVIENEGWSLYFNNKPCTMIQEGPTSSGLNVKHINGDFFRLYPTAKMGVLNQGDSLIVDLYSNSQMIKGTDVPLGFYFQFLDTIIEPSISYSSFPESQMTLGSRDIRPVETAEIRYDRNTKTELVKLTPEQLILPTPMFVEAGNGLLNIKDLSAIDCPTSLAFEKDLLKNTFKYLGDNSDKNGRVKVELQPLDFSNSKEAYTLDVNENGILIQANEKSGVFYAIQSLKQMRSMDASNNKIPFIKVKDVPRFEYRGLTIDVARNFQTKEEILKVLDAMGYYKVNKLQLQLSDDEGWRIDIPSLPELAEIGSTRGYDKRIVPSYGSGAQGTKNISNGFYSREDFIEILTFAKNRNIEIRVQLEFPGHARASIEAMKSRTERLLDEGKTEEAHQYSLVDELDKSEYLSIQNFDDNTICPCQNGVYNFIDEVIVQFKSMYQEAGLELNSIHLGGDEVAQGVWEESPMCRTQFGEGVIRDKVRKFYITEVLKLGEKHQVHLAFWDDFIGDEEIDTEYSSEDLSIYSWNNMWGEGNEDRAYRAANMGYSTILVPVSNLYFDQAYSKNSEEPGFYWGSYVDTYAAFSFLPLNMFKMNQKTKNGHELKPSYFDDKTNVTAEGERNIKGISASLFSETIKGADDLEYLLFPKLLGLAERAWAPGFIDAEDNAERITEKLQERWTVFANVLGQRELYRLMEKGIGFRKPPQGEKVIDGTLRTNTIFPGLE